MGNDPFLPGILKSQMKKNAQTPSSVPTTADIVVLYYDKTGTATMNTDLKVWASRDNGTTWTQGTLVATDSTIDDEVVVSAHDIDISGQPSGTQVRYKIVTANQAAGSKVTRVQGVGMSY
mgnify:CR=1 FL=1